MLTFLCLSMVRWDTLSQRGSMSWGVAGSCLTICAGSRQRLQQLPDSQRREAAERMALQMMEAFGLEDAGESDDSDS